MFCKPSNRLHAQVLATLAILPVKERRAHKGWHFSLCSYERIPAFACLSYLVNKLLSLDCSLAFEFAGNNFDGYMRSIWVIVRTCEIMMINDNRTGSEPQDIKSEALLRRDWFDHLHAQVIDAPVTLTASASKASWIFCLHKSTILVSGDSVEKKRVDTVLMEAAACALGRIIRGDENARATSENMIVSRIAASRKRCCSFIDVYRSI